VSGGVCFYWAFAGWIVEFQRSDWCGRGRSYSPNILLFFFLYSPTSRSFYSFRGCLRGISRLCFLPFVGSISGFGFAVCCGGPLRRIFGLGLVPPFFPVSCLVDILKSDTFLLARSHACRKEPPSHATCGFYVPPPPLPTFIVNRFSHLPVVAKALDPLPQFSSEAFSKRKLGVVPGCAWTWYAS